MYIIVCWTDPEHAVIVNDGSGQPMLFATYTEAIIYAMRNIAFKWKVVHLEG